MYKFARKTVHLETNLEFLTKCLDISFIPKSFKIKNSLPGNNKANQTRLENISIQAIIDEKQKHGDKLVRVRAEFEKNKRDLVKVFDDSKHVESEVKRVEVHMRKIKTKRIKTQEKKLPRNDTNDDRNEISSREEELTVATPAKVKRKRRFRRRYLQPQPKKIRKRRSERTEVVIGGKRGTYVRYPSVPYA